MYIQGLIYHLLYLTIVKLPVLIKLVQLTSVTTDGIKRAPEFRNEPYHYKSKTSRVQKLNQGLKEKLVQKFC